MELKAKINQQAADEEARKIRLEKRFTPAIRSLFARMLRAFQDRYIAAGTVFDFNAFADDWRAALKTQYVRVGREFTNNARKSAYVADLQIKQDDEGLTIEEVATLGAAFLGFSQIRSVTQSQFITATSNQDAMDATRAALATLRAENPLVEPSNADVAREASKQLQKDFDARTGVISNMETQAPAEQAKALEAAALAGAAILPFQSVERVPDRVTKLWATILDGAERPAHHAANGQKVDINDTFKVGGEELLFPGDTSQGASMGNVANCRCSAVFEKENRL